MAINGSDSSESIPSRAAIRGHAVSVAYAVRLPRYMLAFNGAEIVADAEAAIAVQGVRPRLKRQPAKETIPTVCHSAYWSQTSGIVMALIP